MDAEYAVGDPSKLFMKPLVFLLGSLGSRPHDTISFPCSFAT